MSNALFLQRPFSQHNSVGPVMSLVEHAERELELAGIEEDVRPSLLAAINAFTSYGHSGSSAMYCVEILYRLLRYQNLTPIGASEDEWQHVDVPEAGYESVWQNRRRSSTFSRDGGQTWYDIDDPTQCNGDAWGFGCPTASDGTYIKTTYRHNYATDEDGQDIVGSVCLDCGEINR